MMEEIWIFNGEKNAFPSAVFESKKEAFDWVKINKLTGTLTLYPLNISVYDWAIKNEYFITKQEYQKSPTFIANFSSASMEHYHFVEGDKD